MRELLKSKARRIELVLALVLFLAEGFLYLTFRSTELNMFRLYEHAGPWVNSLREWGSSLNMPYWVRYNLPDGLWLLSYLLLVDAIWNRFDKMSCVWYLIMPAIAFGSELAQVWWGLTGTADMMDFVCYAGAVAVTLIVVYSKNYIRKRIAAYA
ncbi:MAG: hypothetical protein K5899_06610 [Bacteroidaceae bacterium]|jgi:hypothetical protein|nr:hypothetical protein [Bacteroidaceae bacterium]MCR4836040.1 hypothetical protein [Bacteroidaceae bacterium]